MKIFGQFSTNLKFAISDVRKSEDGFVLYARWGNKSDDFTKDMKRMLGQSR